MRNVTPLGAVFVLMILLVPIAGWIAAVCTGDAQWLVLLAPLVVFMEGGIALIVVASVAAYWIIGG